MKEEGESRVEMSDSNIRKVPSMQDSPDRLLTAIFTLFRRQSSRGNIGHQRSRVSWPRPCYGGRGVMAQVLCTFNGPASHGCATTPRLSWHIIDLGFIWIV